MKINTHLIYDAKCKFCTASIHWLKAHGLPSELSCIGLDSAEARHLLKTKNIQFAQKNTVYFIANDIVYTKSDAVFQALRLLPTWHSRLAFFSIVPKSIRNKVYDFVAKNRHRF